MAMDVPTAVEPPAAQVDPLRAIDDAALELVPAAVRVCNAAGVVVRYNRRAAELWGGKPVPVRKGSGARLIERGLARELGGSARLDFLPVGVACEIEAPLP